MMSGASSTWLNFFRWLAALAVLITHTENVLLAFIVNVPPTEAKTGQTRRWLFGRLRVRLRPSLTLSN